MADYDSPWKEALDVFFEAFLQLFFPQAHAEIDWGRPWESLDKELQQIAPEAEIGRRYVDKLVKVWLKSGEEQWVLIHVEVQMSDEAIFPGGCMSTTVASLSSIIKRWPVSPYWATTTPIGGRTALVTAVGARR